MYAILVAPPGVGKSNVLKVVETTLRAVPNIFVAPSSLTTASLIDSVALSKRQITTPGQATAIQEFHAMQTVASELGVFLPIYEGAYMNTLTKLYDGEHYEERRRTGKVNHLIIERPLLSIIGGTTPSYLNSFLPDGAWDQGFTSRTIFIFSAEIIKTPIWGKREDYDRVAKLQPELVEDLKSIAQVYGEMIFSEEAQTAINEWYQVQDLTPIPEHPKLAHYNSRRLAHCLKICMALSMSRSADLFVTLEDFLVARRWLLEVEAVMPDIFSAVTKGVDANTLDEVTFFVKRVYYKDGKKPVSERLILEFLRDRMALPNIKYAIQLLESTGAIVRVNVSGLFGFRPVD
jgi:hypothetical protein